MRFSRVFAGGKKRMYDRFIPCETGLRDMKAKALIPLLLAAVLVSGCTTYQYHVLQPPGVAQPVRKEPVTVQYDPLQYHLRRNRDRLEIQVFNPTEDQISIKGDRSFVVDPRGASRPVRAQRIAPHSFVGMLLPPQPIIYSNFGWPGWGWGWGWSWGPYAPFYYPFYADYYVPPVYDYQVVTPYDWEWRSGAVRLRLTYERNGTTFEHNFEITREPEK